MHEVGGTGTVGYTMDKTDSTSTNNTKTSTAIESNTNAAGSGLFTEVQSSTGTMTETENDFTGVYTLDATGTKGSTFSQSGHNGTGTFGVTEGTGGTYSKHETGNLIAGSFTQTETDAYSYSMTETNNATNSFTLSDSGTINETLNKTGNRVTGLYTATTTGTDTYTLTETGTNGGGFSETVSGSESFTVTETGNSGAGEYQRTTTGGGSYTLIASGAGLSNGSGTTGYTLTETANPLSGNFSQTQTGTTRYNLLEGFNNVADTGGSSTPGHLNFSSFGAPFVDPTRVVPIGPDGKPDWEAVNREEAAYRDQLVAAQHAILNAYRAAHPQFVGTFSDMVRREKAIKELLATGFPVGIFADENNLWPSFPTEEIEAIARQRQNRPEATWHTPLDIAAENFVPAKNDTLLQRFQKALNISMLVAGSGQGAAKVPGRPLPILPVAEIPGPLLRSPASGLAQVPAPRSIRAPTSGPLSRPLLEPVGPAAPRPSGLPAKQVSIAEVERLAGEQAGKTHVCNDAARQFENLLPEGTAQARDAGGHAWVLVNTNQGARYIDTSGFTIARARQMGLGDVVRQLEKCPVFTLEEWQNLMQQLGLQ